MLGVAFDYDGLGLLQVGEADVVPTGLGAAAEITGIVAVDVTGDVGKCEVFEDHAGVIGTVAAGGILVLVGLFSVSNFSNRYLDCRTVLPV